MRYVTGDVMRYIKVNFPLNKTIQVTRLYTFLIRRYKFYMKSIEQKFTYNIILLLKKYFIFSFITYVYFINIYPYNRKF